MVFMRRLVSRLARSHNVQLDVYPLRCQISRALQLRRAFTTTCPRVDDKSDRVAVKWFEQDGPWSAMRREVDPSKVQRMCEEEIREAQAEIDRLDAELRDLENPPDGKTFIEELLVKFPEEEQKRLREAIKQDELNRAQKAEELALAERKAEERLPKKTELEIRWELPKQQNTYLQHLNDSIYDARTKLGDRDVRKKLWQSYSRCKAFLPPFLHLIPEKAWKMLFASQLISIDLKEPRWGQLVTLSEDRLGAGKGLDRPDRMMYVEALCKEKRYDTAVSQWQELMTQLRDEDELSGQYGELSDQYELQGVRLFASKGDPEKAANIASKFLRKGKLKYSRILIPIIDAWAQRGDETGFKHAWFLYLQLKKRLDSEITMADYDTITLSFLHSGRADLALAVFKDMMLTGQKTDQGSIALYENSLGFLDKVESGAITVKALNRFALTGLTILPKRFQNKFFFGKWLRKLLSMGATDAAASVLELMYERGVRPDSKHLNGIIGAWLRSGTDTNKGKAEQMAWAMVYERIDLVKNRRERRKADCPTVPNVRGPPIPAHLRRTVSPATIETIALLLLHYTRKTPDGNALLLQQCLLATEIEPDSGFINQLIELDLRQGRYRAAFTKYQVTFQWQMPDIDTFTLLWGCEKAHLDTLAIKPGEQFPHPRELMNDMMKWLSMLNSRPHERKRQQEAFKKPLYDQILRCLCDTGDLEGVVVAAYALKEFFGYYPDIDNSRMVSLQAKRMGVGEQGAQSPRRRGRSRGKVSQRPVDLRRIDAAYSNVSEKRGEVLKAHGIDLLRSNDLRMKEEEALFMLGEFVRGFLRVRGADEETIERKFQKAAWDMGVGNIRMDDPILSYHVQNEALDGVETETETENRVAAMA